MASPSESNKKIEVRCPRGQCICQPQGGKLLATLFNLPAMASGRGVVLQLACPNKKSHLLRVEL